MNVYLAHSLWKSQLLQKITDKTLNRPVFVASSPREELWTWNTSTQSIQQLGDRACGRQSACVAAGVSASPLRSAGLQHLPSRLAPSLQLRYLCLDRLSSSDWLLKHRPVTHWAWKPGWLSYACWNVREEPTAPGRSGALCPPRAPWWSRSLRRWTNSHSFFFFLTVPCGLWDLSFPKRDWTQAKAVTAMSPNH